MIKSRIKKIRINNWEAEWAAYNAYCTWDDWDVFLTLDPIYTIITPHQLTKGVKNIQVMIEGELATCTQQEIADCVFRKK